METGSVNNFQQIRNQVKSIQSVNTEPESKVTNPKTVIASNPIEQDNSKQKVSFQNLLGYFPGIKNIPPDDIKVVDTIKDVSPDGKSIMSTIELNHGLKITNIESEYEEEENAIAFSHERPNGNSEEIILNSDGRIDQSYRYKKDDTHMDTIYDKDNDGVYDISTSIYEDENGELQIASADKNFEFYLNNDMFGSSSYGYKNNDGSYTVVTKSSKFGSIPSTRTVSAEEFEDKYAQYKVDIPAEKQEHFTKRCQSIWIKQ